jgi:hypothetical protein
MNHLSRKFATAFKLITLVVWCLPAFLQAQTFCVRQGATGTGTGSDWTNAYAALPATLQRGATYYVADGTYPSYTFDDPVSTSTYITIRKATATVHGTDTGWQLSYGDGEALFTGSGNIWTFTTGFYDMDGVVGYGKSPGGFGFRLLSTSARSTTTHLIYFGGTPINGLRIRHAELDWNNGTGTSTSAVTRGFDAGTASHDGTLFQSCYSHHSSGFHFFVLNSANMTIERCYFYQNGGGGGDASHWESFWFTYGFNLSI